MFCGPNGAGDSPPTDDGRTRRLSTDRTFSLLADARRRRVVQFFRERNGAPIGELATHVCEGKSEDECRVLASLVHVHLPKLADAAVLEWEQGETVVRRGETFSQVQSVLSVATPNENR